MSIQVVATMLPDRHASTNPLQVVDADLRSTDVHVVLAFSHHIAPWVNYLKHIIHNGQFHHLLPWVNYLKHIYTQWSVPSLTAMGQLSQTYLYIHNGQFHHSLPWVNYLKHIYVTVNLYNQVICILPDFFS